MKIIIALFVVLLSTNASAGYASGTVQKLIIGRQGHQIFIHLNTTVINSCTEKHPNGFNYAFSMKSHDAGKEMLSALLAAYTAKKSIAIQGNGVCTVDASMEDVGYVYLLP